MAKYGIDVCSYQGNIDWKKVKAAGCKFAILKCIMKGLGLDSKFVANVKGCRENGIPISVYTYVYENTIAGAEARAKAAVKACKDQNIINCIIWWDVEDPSIRKTGVNNRAKLTASIKAARDIITTAGYGFGVYCDSDFYTSCINANDLGGKYWIAAYHGNPVTTLGQAPKYNRPVIANELCGWQFCSKGRVSGIAGSVDLNIAYDDDFISWTNSAQDKSDTNNSRNPYETPIGTVTSNAQASLKKCASFVSSGSQVKFIQWELVRLGYDLGSSGIDGDCGAKTVAAILEFQSASGLTVDGLAGKKTVNALISAKSKPVKHVQNESTKQKGKIDYLSLSAKYMKTVYDKIVSIHCKHAGGATTYEEICKKKVTTCSTSVSAVLQKAGVLQKGKKLGHTTKDGHGGSTKTTYKKALYGTEYLVPGTYSIVKIGKKFADLDDEYKKPGIVYVQDSNICMYAGGGYIYSTNQGSVQYKDGRYIKDKVKTGYPFTSKILYVIVPKS